MTAQTYGLLVIGSHTALRCSADAPTALARPALSRAAALYMPKACPYIVLIINLLQRSIANRPSMTRRALLGCHIKKGRAPIEGAALANDLNFYQFFDALEVLAEMALPWSP